MDKQHVLKSIRIVERKRVKVLQGFAFLFHASCFLNCFFSLVTFYSCCDLAGSGDHFFAFFKICHIHIVRPATFLSLSLFDDLCLCIFVLHLYAWRLAKRLWRNAVLSSLQFVDVIYECTSVNRPQSPPFTRLRICHMSDISHSLLHH